MKLIRAVKRTKLVSQILRAPIILITVVLSALLGLSSCGGGESVNSNGSKMMVMPGGKFYGAIVADLSPGEGSCGFAAGIATGYTTRQAAKSAAEAKCQQAGGVDCTTDTEFGSAYRGENACGALAYGYRKGAGCGIYPRSNATQKTAEAEAIAACETSEHARTNQLDCAYRLVSACSTSGPASSVSRSQSGSSSGGPRGGGTPQVTRTFNDVTVRQGATLTWSNVSDSFSDPDGDRLKITAQSNHSYATARISGDDLIVTGVTAFTDGAVTITVTATDPGGLSVSQRFSVKVTGSGRGGPGDGTQTRYYSELRYDLSSCERGVTSWGRATRTSEAEARTIAIQQCGTSCRGYIQYGSAYGQQCYAVFFGRGGRSGTCNTSSSAGTTQTNAETAARNQCRAVYSECTRLASGCGQ